MWTEITRPKYERTGQRYASDLSDREWAVIAPLMPAPKRLGRPRETDLRAVLDAILYMRAAAVSGGMLPKDFPTVHNGAGVFLPLAGQRPVRADQLRAFAASPRHRRARAEPLGGGDRQPIGQDHRGPRGY